MSARTETRLAQYESQLRELRAEHERLAERVRQLEAGDSREPIVPPPFPERLRLEGYRPPSEVAEEDPP